MAADELTRTRLLEAAGPVFAEHGYHNARIRTICLRAGANVAAVNYHFRDKLGLYTEVLRYSLAAMLPNAPVDKHASPEHALRGFIQYVLGSMFDSSRPAWHLKLMLQEMMLPTPALDVIIEQLIRPQSEMLGRAIGSIAGLPPESRIVKLCLHSVVGQVRHYLIARDVIGRVWPEFRFTSKELDEVAEHIAVFSLAGIQAAKGRAKEN